MTNPDNAAKLSSENKLKLKDKKSQVDGDGLVIMSRGLGLRKVLLAFLNIYSHNKNLVILLNTSQQEIESLKEELAIIQKSRNGQSFLKIINNETPSSERYKKIVEKYIIILNIFFFYLIFFYLKNLFYFFFLKLNVNCKNYC